MLPKLSIAAKLYTIFTLLALATFALAGIAVVNARHQRAMTAEYETSLIGTQNVERVNGLIYAVVMESRGVYMSPDIPAAKRYGDLLLKFKWPMPAALIREKIRLHARGPQLQG